MKGFKLILAAACGLLASCAIITVNVYFPEKAVKDAFKSVDGMMLKGGDDATTLPETLPNNGVEKVPEVKPLSRIIRMLPNVSFAATAHAADNNSDELAVELASMPEVTQAYEVMSKNLSRVRELLATGVVGLTNQGLITARDKTGITPQDETMLKAENNSRKVIITGMAKAILKINKQTEASADMGQLLGKSAATYAEAKREEAAPGWWMQLQNGRWVQK